MIRFFAAVSIAVCLGVSGYGQTKVNLRTQGGDVDFSSAPSTKPFRSGPTLPSTCTSGETFFKTLAPGSAFVCSASNTWTEMGGVKALSSLQGVTGTQGNTGVIQMSGGGVPANNSCAAFDSNGNLVSAGAPCGNATSVNGMAVQPGTPVSGGQFYGWDADAQQLVLYTLGPLLTISGDVIDVATESVTQYAAGDTVPASCSQYGLLFFQRTAGAGGKLYYCNGSTYEALSARPGGTESGIQYNSGGTFAAITPNSATQRKFAAQSGNGAVANPPAFVTLSATDLPLMAGSGANHSSGAVPDPGAVAGTAKYLREDGVWSAPPAGTAGVGDPGTNGLLARTSANTATARALTGGSGNVVVTNGDGVAGNPTVDLGANVELLSASQSASGDRVFLGKVDARGATASAPFKTGANASLPAVCDVGQTYFASDAPVAQRLRFCAAANVWAPASYDQGVVAGLPAACQPGQIYFATDATVGRNLYFCASSNTWTQQAAGSGGGGGYQTVLSNGTSQSQRLALNVYHGLAANDDAANQRTNIGIVIDPSISVITEEFPPNLSGSGQIGTHGWSGYGSGNSSHIAGSANHPGIQTIVSGTTAGSGQMMALGDISSGVPFFPNLAANSNWEAHWIFQIATNVTDEAARAGLADGSNASGDSNSMAVEFDPSLSANLQFLICSGGGCARYDSGIAASIANWYHLKLVSTSPGVVAFSLSSNGGAFTSAILGGTGQTINKALPAQPQFPYFYVKTNSSGSRTLNCDYWAGMMTGLAR
jgi:hypothetical protein